MPSIKTISPNQLNHWLETGKEVTILDIRPLSERNIQTIPTSIHLNAYESLKAGYTEILDHLELDKHIPVVTFCTGGKLSEVVSEILSDKGFDSHSLEGGMKAWNNAYIATFLEFGYFKIIQIEHFSKKSLSFIVGSGTQAIVIDASLEPNIYKEIGLSEGWTIDFVDDTHILNMSTLDNSQKTDNKLIINNLLSDYQKEGNPFFSVSKKKVMNLGEISIQVFPYFEDSSDNTAYLIDNKILLKRNTSFTKKTEKSIDNSDKSKRKSVELLKSLRFINSLSNETLIIPMLISQLI